MIKCFCMILQNFYYACVILQSRQKGHHKHFTLNTCYAKLCQSRMEPIMYYVAGVCGTDIRRIIQLIQNKALRYFLGSKKIASNTATRGYLGWCLAYTKQILEVFRLLFFIQHSSNNMLIKNNRICSSLILRSCDYKVKHVIQKSIWRNIVKSNT